PASAARTRARRPPGERPRRSPRSGWGTPGVAREPAARPSRAAGNRSSTAACPSSRTQTAAASNPGRFSRPSSDHPNLSSTTLSILGRLRSRLCRAAVLILQNRSKLELQRPLGESTCSPYADRASCTSAARADSSISSTDTPRTCPQYPSRNITAESIQSERDAIECVLKAARPTSYALRCAVGGEKSTIEATCPSDTKTFIVL